MWPQHEILSNHTQTSSHLPKPTSDLTSAISLAPDEEGDLVVSMYLMGGCISLPEEETITTTSNECREVSDGNTVYDPHLDEFEDRTKMLWGGRYKHSANSVDGKIWVVGGRNGDDELVLEVDVFDPIHNTWLTIGTLPPNFAVSDHASFAREDVLYIAGGYDMHYEAVSRTFAISTIQSLESGELKIKELSRMGTERGGIHALMYSRYGYVIGGFTHQDGYCNPHHTVEAFDTHRNVWIPVGNLTIGRGNVGLMKFRNRFFAWGGETRQRWGEEAKEQHLCLGDSSTNRKYPRRETYPLSTVEVYDPKEGLKGQWQVIQGGLANDDIRSRFILQPWEYNQSIYLMGGVKHVKRGVDGCQGDKCLKLSDSLLIFSDELKNDSLLATTKKEWYTFMVGTLSLLVVLACFGRMILQKRNKFLLRNESQRNESIVALVQRQHSSEGNFDPQDMFQTQSESEWNYL